jgi:predicted transcriptional regulator
MEIQLTPEQENLLAQLATDKGQAADSLVTEVIRQYLDEETRFIAAVKLGEDEMERGEYLTGEQVRARLDQLFNS